MSNIILALFNASAAGACLSAAIHQRQLNEAFFILMFFSILNVIGVIVNWRLGKAGRDE